MKKNVKQELANLPKEILEQPRFFAVNADKTPKVKGWSNPENQKLYSEIEGLAGFDTAGHSVADDFLFLDFDHVFNERGEFVNALAEEWYTKIKDALRSYSELSASGKGAHIIALPTAGKFKKISGKNGRIYFSDRRDKDAPYLEVFYGTGGRYCLFTGNVFDCEPNTPVTHGQAADDVFQLILDEIAKNNTKPNSEPCAEKTKTSNNAATLVYQSNGNSRAFDTWRACKMLEIIPVALLSREDWVNVGMALKNNGNSVSDWEQWSRPDDRFKDGECETLWQGFNGNGLTIGTIADIANQYGYDAKAVWKEWCNLHPEFKNQIIHRPAPMDDQQEQFSWTQDKIKSCPVNLRLPTDYTFSQGGISLIVESKKGVKYIPATKTAIVPTKIFREPQKSKYTYEIAILIRGAWRTVEVEGRALADPRAILTLADTGALIDEPKILCRFLNAVISLNPDIAEIKAYAQTGWTDDTFTNFAYPRNDDCIVRRAGFDFTRDLATRGDAELWKQKFIEVLDKGGAFAAMYIGTGLAAVLARPLNILNPQTHLQSKSGGGKTALQKFTASIFGNPRKLLRTFAATNKNRQLVAAAFCDLPTFFDEMETLSGKAAEENLSNDIYNFAEGKGNQANRRDGTARETFEFGGARLTTGERPMLKTSDLRGAYKRLIQLVISGNLFDDDFAADLHIFSESNFGHFGLTWIQFVTENMKSIQAEYQHRASRRDPTTKTYEPTHLKQVSACLVAVEFFKVMLGVTSKFDSISFIRNWRAIVETLPTIAEFDDSTRAIESLSSYVASHEKSFMRDETSNETGKPIEIGSWGTVCSGKIFDTGEVAIFPTELKRILEEELNFPSTEKLLIEWKEQGNILITDKNRKDHKITLNGKRPRVIHFKAGVIGTSCDSAEAEYYESISEN